MNKGIDKGSLARTIVLVLALINQFLVSAGLNPIEGDMSTWYEIATAAITAITAGLAWFKNNYITLKGKRQKEVLKREGLTKAK